MGFDDWLCNVLGCATIICQVALKIVKVHDSKGDFLVRCWNGVIFVCFLTFWGTKTWSEIVWIVRFGILREEKKCDEKSCEKGYVCGPSHRSKNVGWRWVVCVCLGYLWCLHTFWCKLVVVELEKCYIQCHGFYNGGWNPTVLQRVNRAYRSPL